MKCSDQIDKISEALAKAQGAMRNPEKNQTAEIVMKSGGQYSYRYADLPSIYDCARQALSENGLAHASTIEHTAELGMHLCMRLIHSSGQWYESVYPLPNDGDDKTLAGKITYGRRYLFTALTGLAAEDDLDDDTPKTVKPVKQSFAPRPIPNPVNAPLVAIPKAAQAITPPVEARIPGQISDAQVTRLIMIAKEHGWTDHDVKSFILKSYNLDSKKKLNQKQYEYICTYMAEGIRPEVQKFDEVQS
jgi:hypothetical protein